MITEEILLFCRNISDADLKKLPFQKAVFEDVSNAWLVTQAQCYQIAKRKIPVWWAKAQVVFPDPQAVEQASSEWLARWKQTCRNATDRSIQLP